MEDQKLVGVTQSEPFKMDERKTVYATDKNKYKQTGAEITVGLVMAQHLVAKGMATESKPKQEKK